MAVVGVAAGAGVAVATVPVSVGAAVAVGGTNGSSEPSIDCMMTRWKTPERSKVLA